MEEKITLSNGKTFETHYVVNMDAQNRLFMRFQGYSIPDLATAFCDPIATAEMTYMGETISGYNFVSRIVDELGTVLIEMWRR